MKTVEVFLTPEQYEMLDTLSFRFKKSIETLVNELNDITMMNLENFVEYIDKSSFKPRIKD